MTDKPIFVVLQKREIVAHADYDHDRIEWLDDEGVEASKTKARRLEALHGEQRDTGRWRRLAIKEVDEFVTACFTERGCREYLEVNGHNLRKPFIYAYGSFRNAEFNVIRDWLMDLPAAPQHPPARQLPEGWRIDRRELDGAICFIIGTPHKNGVRVITSVSESDHDPAHLLLWHLLAAAPQAEPNNDWIVCSKRKPPSGQTVLAFYLNTYGMGRRIRAQHVDAWTIQVDDLSDPDTECVEYSEQEDAYYLLAGWYECIDNWDDYSRIAVNEGIVTHWLPLPAAPALSPEQPGGDS